MATEIEAIILGLRNALAEAEEKLREAKVIPLPLSQRGRTNLDEAKSWVGNALAYGRNGNANFEFTVGVLVSNLERIKKLLDDPTAISHEGPHQ